MNNILSSISFNNILIGHKEWEWTPLPAIDSLKIKNGNSKSKVHIGEL
jgi:hypothetical protein